MCLDWYAGGFDITLLQTFFLLFSTSLQVHVRKEFSGLKESYISTVMRKPRNVH